MVLTTGWGGDFSPLSNTETLEIGSNGQPQSQYQDHTRKINGATGGFLSEDFVTCGGYDFTSSSAAVTEKCYKLGASGSFASMMTKRFHAASIVLEDEKMWILGGVSNGFSTLSSTEYIFSDGRNEDGPPMPIALDGHAMVKINDTTSLLVGGYRSGHGQLAYSKMTWFYDGKWIEGPDLQKGRHAHSVGIIRDSVTLHEYVVAAGGENGFHLNDVEILDAQENKWEPGKLL